MEPFYWIEESKLGLLISSSLWGYPIALSLHALGMGVLVGISVMLALRVIGFAQAIPKSAILPYWRLAQAGLLVNLLSGLALLAGSASSLVTNWAFYAKFACLFLAVFLTWRMVRISYREEQTGSTGNRLLAFATLAAWVATIIFGRIIGYVF